MDTALLEQLPVLSDPIRARLLRLLDDHELTVSELCDVLQLPQSTVSRHLKTLADARWVTSRREATSRFYAVAADELGAGARQLWTLVRQDLSRTASVSEDERRLKGVLARRRARSEEFFSSAAGQWDRLREELFGPANYLRGLLGWLDDDWRVGDLGCGTGQVSEAIAPFVSSVIAVDGSADMLRAAQTRLRDVRNVDFRCGTLESLPIEDGGLDAACMMLVLHHAPDPGKVLAEAARVLRPGGRLLVVDMLPHDREEYRQTMGHVWLGFSDRQVLRWLEAASFERTRVHALPSDAHAKGPGLFAATSRRPVADVREPESLSAREEVLTGHHGPLSKES